MCCICTRVRRFFYSARTHNTIRFKLSCIATVRNTLYRLHNQIVFLPANSPFLTQTEVRIPSACGVYNKLIQFHSVIQCNTYCCNATFLNDEMKNPRMHCRCGRQWVRGVGILWGIGRCCQILCREVVLRSVCRPDADRVLAEILSALPVLLPKKIRLLSSKTESFRLHRKRKKRRKKPRDLRSRGFLCGCGSRI